MLPISRSERDKLESVGLLKFKKTGLNPQEPNFSICNKRNSKSKTYSLVENPVEMRFLGYFYDNGIQKIKKEEYDILVREGTLKEGDIQIQGTYIPSCKCYFWDENSIWIIKEPKMMIRLGYWRSKN